MARTSSTLLAAAVVALALPAAARAGAPDATFAGTWRIVGAVLAPWATPEQGFPDEVKRMVGRQVRFTATAVRGPAPLACAPPVYSVRPSDGPEMLFEGGLEGPDARQKAQKLGMAGPTVATLEVGCSEIAYHLLAPGVLSFALDNQIYTLRRVR